MDEFYKVKCCRGLCLQVDSLGMCLGVCSTDFENATQVYFKNKSEFLRAGKPWVDIEDFELTRKPTVEVALDVPIDAGAPSGLRNRR